MSDLQGGAVRPRRPLPSGTVTFLFTDIEGSTQLLRRLGEEFGRVLSEHRALLRDAFDSHGGVEVHAEGDSSLTVFTRAGDAVAAALDGQRAIAARAWPPGGEVRVRMGIHTGEAVVVADDYVGLAVHQAARICAAGHGGQVLVSETSGELASAGLPTGAILMPLGEYRLKDVEAPERLHQLVHPDLDPSFPPLRVLEVLPNNLPTALSSFVGREEALEEVRRLLGATRLVTIRGPGGAGKTRLALEAARGLLERFVDGVWLVDLASLTEDGLIPQRVASVLGVREEPSRELTETLTDRLRGSDLLLVLDNCEHVLDACARFLTDLMRACPGVRVLATSREPLGVPGETTWLVTPMDVPEADGLDPYALLGFDAVRLFVERACTVQPGFVMTPSEADHVAQVCRRLDGIPLAIELAAARVRVLTPKQLAERLDDRFRLLTGGDRTAEARHQTLRATVDWSYELLSGRERILFRRLGVFAGSWTLEAAEGICEGRDLAEVEVLDALTALVDKSLVLSRPDGAATTYRMLETVRMYALDRLREAGEEEAAAARFRAWYLDLAEETSDRIGTREQAAMLDVLDREHDNLRAALSSCLESGDLETALRLATALGRYWSARGHLGEGRLWLWAVLEQASEPTITRARALGEAGRLTEAQCDYPAARRLYAESLTLAGELGDRALAAQRLANLGSVDWLEGSYDEAVRRQHDALEIAREIDDPTLVARCLHNLGTVEFVRGRREEAEAHFAEALEIRRRVDDVQGVAETLNNLGIIARIAGDLPQAHALAEESLSVARALGHRPLIAHFGGNLGIVLQREGALSEAKTMFEESLSIHRELGHKDGVAIVLNSVGNAAYLQGDHASARAAYTESIALRRELGDRRGTAESLANLGSALREQGELEAAARHLEESLDIRRELGDRSGVAGSLHGLALVARRRSDTAAALRLALDGLREAEASGDRGRLFGLFESFVEIASEVDPGCAALAAGAARSLADGAGTDLDWIDEAVARLRDEVDGATVEGWLSTGAGMTVGEVVARCEAAAAT
ncbi:MAG TPA: tetratricopeptide repeat protein [Actinomycetota bacterium]|nr:tetratricopeptide repeat protein [Actinomycetota bacterium]